MFFFSRKEVPSDQGATPELLATGDSTVTGLDSKVPQADPGELPEAIDGTGGSANVVAAEAEATGSTEHTHEHSASTQIEAPRPASYRDADDDDYGILEMDLEELLSAESADPIAGATNSEPNSSDASDVPPVPRRMPRVRGKRLARPDAPQERQRTLTPQQRLLLLDSWRRSGLPAKDFAALVGVSKHSLYAWNQQFEKFGPEGLLERPRRERAGRLPELTKRTILMLKESHPEWGCERISDMLRRGPALAASPSSVARVLHDAGYELMQEPSRAHRDVPRRFERASPNQLWQTDLFTFMLKRQNRRVYLVAFMDDHSRFITSYGLHASASTALVLEALEAGISSYGPPEEVLTDNGPQYVTWRGKSQFTRRLEQRGIRQIVARPRRPQTLGKIERFWGTLWREFLETAVFVDLAEARTRIGLFIDYYNFQRIHRGVEGMVPADRYFQVASELARLLKERVAANSLELARHGVPRPPFYVTGQLDGQAFSVHAEGPRIILTRPGQSRQEVELTAPSPANKQEAPQSVGENNTVESRPLPTPVCPHGSPAENATDDETIQEPSCDEPLGGDA